MPGQPRSFAIWLAGCTALGALVRILRLVAVKWDQPLLLNDSLYYSAQARQLTEGRWFREIFVDQPGAEHGPLTSLVLAPVSWGTDPVPLQRTVTVLLGIVTVPLIGVLGRRIGGDRVGILAAAIAAVYPNLWMNDGLVMSESLATLLVVAALVLLLPLPTGRARDAIAVGVVVGLATLTRSELALFAPLAWWVFARSGAPRREVVRAAVVLTVTAVLVVAPWTLFNLVRFERPVLLTTNDGTTLLGAYCAETFDGPFRAGWYVGCVVDHPTYDLDAEPSVRSGKQRAAALEFARERATELPAMAVRRVARTFDLTAIDQLIAQDVGEEREEWAVRAGIASFLLLAPLAAVGAMRVRRDHLRVLALPVVTTVLVSALFYGAHRFRTPMEPVVVVLAAVTIVDLGRSWTSRREGRAAPRSPAAP